jgi:Uma2 family endonuclease
MTRPEVGMTDAENKLLTLDEFLALPDEPGKQELLNGELILLPPAKSTHTRISFNLALYLHSLGLPLRVFHEMAYLLNSKSIVQPDVSVIEAKDRRLEREYFVGAPLLAVEVISPANRDQDMFDKRVAYFEHGAEEVWIVYPKRRALDVHRAGGSSDLYVRGPFQSAVLGCEIDPAQFL